MKRTKKETERWLKDFSLLLDRDDAYVDLGPADSPTLPKRERKDRYYSTKDPKYWIDHSILVGWLMYGSSTILEKCANIEFQDWYLKEYGIEYYAKWLTQEDVERLIGLYRKFYKKELKQIKHFVLRFFEQFSYKDTKGRTHNYFFKNVGARGIAGEMQLFITYLSCKLARYRALLLIRNQLHKKIDWMMRSKNEREKLQYQFGSLIKVTYRKNDVLLKALCYMIDELMKGVTYPDRLVKVVPFIFSKLDIFPSKTSQKKCNYKTDRRQLCSNVDCFNKKIKSCLYSSPIVSCLHENKMPIDKEEYECAEKRKTLCRECDNEKKSPFQSLCLQGTERFYYFVHTGKKNYDIKEVSYVMKWLTRYNFREVNTRCPFCGMKLFQYYLSCLFCMTCKSLFPYYAQNNLDAFKDKKPISIISFPAKV